MKRAKSFYSKVFDWKLTDMPMPSGEYTLVGTTESDENGTPKKPGSINGGMMKMTEPFTGPIITLQVEDMDDVLRQVEKNGGKTVTKKTSMGEIGWYGYFRDSEGNLMGLFQSP